MRSLEGLVQPNMQRLEKEWRMSGDVLMRAVIRKPRTLGLSVDCEGTCQGLCSKCWAVSLKLYVQDATRVLLLKRCCVSCCRPTDFRVSSTSQYDVAQL